MQPDQAVVNANVETHNTTNAGAAVADNEATYEHVVAALTALGIARSDVTLSYYNVNYTAPPQGDRNNTDYGFTVNRSFAITVRQIALAGRVVDTAIGAGVTNVSGVTFGLQNGTAASNEAMARAVTDATNRAEALARDARLHIVGIASIAFGSVYTPTPVLRAVALTMAAPQTTFDSGNTTISETVTMVFLANP